MKLGSAVRKLNFQLKGFIMHLNSMRQKRNGSVLQRMNKLGKKADVFASGIREHGRLRRKISETVKGKLSLGTIIFKMGGMEKAFKTLFNVSKKERLLKASQCYLLTLAGPVAGLLFISTQNIAFCSERSLKISSPNGECLRLHYKSQESEDMKKPSQKYLQIVTVDNFEFWFMGFLNYQKTNIFSRPSLKQI
ncbi:hypothetical protein CDL15_Pgr020958 [Punica granatum]|uniref:GRAM domain-containing protein n=1 Tax=Punica granatum TaxID=22663 RepID=A0A218Y053_PUNGR|nr:hypothetical protein CDL15_Pgr020958 [Punica granatum]